MGGVIMKLKWNDITSYSKGDKERTPKVLRTRIKNFEITIHRHIYYENTWLLTTDDFQIEKEDLYTDKFEEAETRAIDCILDKLRLYIEDYEYLRLLI